jgi:hypothetical protein
MKDFIRRAGRLRSLPLSARVVYSVFNVFSLLALAETAWLGADMVGANLSGVESYYAGKSAPPPSAAGPAAATSSGGGPVIELPDETLSAEAAAMPLRKLLEVTHFHLFTMPVYLLILAHLYMLSRVRSSIKLSFIAGGSLGVLLHMLAPWIARSGSPLSTVFYGLSGSLLLVCMLVMSVVPLFEMWAPPPAA